MCDDMCEVPVLSLIPSRKKKTACREVDIDFFGIHSLEKHGIFDIDTASKLPYVKQYPNVIKEEEENDG